ncbi:MAG: hypothetical protein ACOY4O_18840 [Pseudomonadota bacterium]
MFKARLAVTAVAGVMLSFAVSGKAMAIGDQPYWPAPYNWEPAIQSGCWKWNWQQFNWYDHCPVYVRPKAYMYPRGAYRPVVRAKY